MTSTVGWRLTARECRCCECASTHPHRCGRRNGAGGTSTASTAQRRFVRRALRLYREQLGLTAEEAAGVLHCDPSKLSRIETGQHRICSAELETLLDVYGVLGFCTPIPSTEPTKQGNTLIRGIFKGLGVKNSPAIRTAAPLMAGHSGHIGTARQK